MTDEDLRNAFRKLVKAPIQVLPAEVLDVDEVNLSITAKPFGAAKLFDVRLKAAIDDDEEGFYEIPEKNSSVLIGIIGNDSDEAFVIKCTKVTKVKAKIKDTVFEMTKDGIVINGGELGGMIKIEEMVKQLKKYNQLLQSMLNIISGSPIPEAGNGSPSALQTSLAAAVAGKQLPSFDGIEDSKFKH